VIDRSAFADAPALKDTHFTRLFPYNYKIDVHDKNWDRYVDGWGLYADIQKEAKRWGIDFATSPHFQLFDNSQF